MYAFVDQPVSALSDGGRFLLWAMRGWIHAASRGQCPPGQLAPGFAKAGALPALPHVHRLLAELNRRGHGEIAFAPLDYARVGDDEAVLLQLWSDATRDAPRAQATLALLVEAEAVGSAFASLLAASAQLCEACLSRVSVRTQASSPRD